MRPVWDLPLSASGIDVQLDDGLTVRIRPIRRDDGPGLLAAYERFGPESRYYRFFSPRPRLTDDMVRALTDIDDSHQLAWAVFDPSRPSEVDDGSGLVIAAARLFVEDDPTTAEATLAIVDEYQGRKIGRFLVELLVGTAAQREIRTIRFDVLHENRAVRALLSKVGATGVADPEDRSVLTYTLPVPELDDADITAGALYVLLRRVADKAHSDG